MHPLDARDRQIENGQRVRVRSATGAISVEVELSDDVVRGSVCYPHGFGHSGSWRKANAIDGANVNLLASSRPEDWEPVSGNCHLDGIPVQVVPRPGGQTGS
jgi:formate dehydrogenase